MFVFILTVFRYHFNWRNLDSIYLTVGFWFKIMVGSMKKKCRQYWGTCIFFKVTNLLGPIHEFREFIFLTVLLIIREGETHCGSWNFKCVEGKNIIIDGVSLLLLWRWNRQCVPKYQHVKSRRLGITQKKEYNTAHGESLNSKECHF